MHFRARGRAHRAASLRRRYYEGTDAGHDIAHNVSVVKRVYQPLVLLLEPGVPVYLPQACLQSRHKCQTSMFASSQLCKRLSQVTCRTACGIWLLQLTLGIDPGREVATVTTPPATAFVPPASHINDMPVVNERRRTLEKSRWNLARCCMTSACRFGSPATTSMSNTR